MSERVRIYHPETDEPFDVPVKRGAELILQSGWRKQPLDPKAVPLVSSSSHEETVFVCDEEETTDEADEPEGAD